MSSSRAKVLSPYVEYNAKIADFQKIHLLDKFYK